MNNFITLIDKGKPNYLDTSTFGICLVTSFLSFTGYSTLADTNGSGLTGQFIALVTAMGIAAFFYTFWRTAQSVITGERRITHSIIGLALILCGLPFVVSISSWSNVTAIAGNAAMNTHIERVITKASHGLTVHYKQSTIIQNLLPDIRRELSTYTKLADNEFKHGTITGSPGSGAVVDFLNATANRLKDLEKVVATHIKTVEKKTTNARKLLDKSRTIANQDTSISERLDGVSRQFDKLNLLLSDIDANGLAESVKRTLASLSIGSGDLIQYSKIPQTATRQKDAIASIEKTLTHTASILSSVADDITKLPSPPEITVERISPMQAVLIYADAYVPAWAAGITLDIACLFPLLFLMLAKSGVSDEERARQRVEGMTIGEVLDAQRSLERTRRLHHPDTKIHRDNDAHFGCEKDDDGDAS